MKYIIFMGLLAVIAAYPYGHEEHKIEEKYDFHEHEPISESGHHHEVEHEHAKSHQSIKFEHFHPVPVYVKKEDSHLLKHPIEKGKSESNLKLIHPKTEHSHGDGLVLEDDRHNTEHHVEHGDFEHFEHGGFDHHHGGFEGFDGGEGLGYSELAHESEGEGHHHFAESGHSFGEADEGYKFEGY